MNLRALETLRLLERLESVSRVAAYLGCPPSTVSMRVRQIEKEFGFPLMQREGKGVRLTQKGRRLAGYAGQILHSLDQAKRELAERQTLGGRVHIGVAELVAKTWLGNFVREINRRYPAVEVELKVELSNPLARLLEQGELDIIFSPGRLVSHKVFRSRFLGEVAVEFMASPTEWGNLGTITRDRIRNVPIVTLGRDSILHEIAFDWLGEGDFTPRLIDVSNNMSTAGVIAAEGLGVSLLTPLMFEDFVASRRLVVLPSDPMVPPLPYHAHFSAHNRQVLMDEIAELAASVSTFSFPGDGAAAGAR